MPVPVPAPVAPPVPEPDGRRERITLVVATAAVCALAAAALWLMLRPAPAPAIGRALRFSQSPPPGTTLVADGVLSPDGQSLAFVTEDDETSVSRLWVRSLNAEDAQVLTGTQGARRPFWSPDSRSIGFFVSDKLKQYFAR